MYAKSQQDLTQSSSIHISKTKTKNAKQFKHVDEVLVLSDYVLRKK